MKEIGILFKPDMIRAILDGRKTMTRRIIKPQPPEWANHAEWLYDGQSVEFWPTAKQTDLLFPANMKGILCRYGQPGDLLYVKETFIKGYKTEDEMYVTDENGDYIEQIWFKADSPNLMWLDGETGNYRERVPWKSPLFLRKEDARIWLRNTGVSVQRLQDISEEDAIKEGIESFRPVPGDGPAETLYKNYLHTNRWQWSANPRASFRSLIQSIHGQEIWDVNPYVWVISFKVLSINGKP